MFSQTMLSKDSNGHKKIYKLLLSAKPIGEGTYGKVCD
jgi:hypothetical protein